MADLNIDKLMKECIIEIIKDKNINQNLEITWKALTRQMFKNYPAIFVYQEVENALKESSDEEYNHLKFPKKFFDENWKSYKKIKIPKGSTIIDVARSFGLEVKGNKAICPFHEDTSPSLSFNSEKNIFHCFGCGKKGNIITFYALMKKIKREDGNKQKRI